MCRASLSGNGSIGTRFSGPHTSTLVFKRVWKKCGSVEKKATKTSTTLFLYIIGSVVVSVDQVQSVANEVWRIWGI